jgi:hypothetical protein
MQIIDILEMKYANIRLHHFSHVTIVVGNFYKIHCNITSMSIFLSPNFRIHIGP